MIIERLRRDEADLAACQAIERASFGRSLLDLLAELGRPHARVWVARQAPEAPPLGFLLAWIVAFEMEIHEVATAPEARRRGVGRALVEAALAEARATRCERVLLEVRESNEAARALYLGLGFLEDGRRRRYYSDPAEDAVLMSLLAPQ